MAELLYEHASELLLSMVNSCSLFYWKYLFELFKIFGRQFSLCFIVCKIFICESLNICIRRYIDDYFQANHITISDTIDISDMALLVDFAKIGVGVACVIKNFVTKELNKGRLVEIPLELPIPAREIGFAYRENTKLSKSMICQ